MASEVLIALDQGSGSSRALAFDRRGRVVARAQAPVRTFRPRPGWCEHDALELALTQEGALKAVLERLPRKADVVGLGVACQRSTVVFWDAKTGRPAARAPSWQDGRASELIARLGARQERAHRKTGLYLTPYYSAPKIRWFLDHVPSVRALARGGRLLAGPVSSFWLWRMSRGDVFAADPSLAQRMLLLDMRSGRWDDELLDWFGIDERILPAIRPSVGPLFIMELAGRRIPIVACLGDQQAAAVGLGGGLPGSSVANFGTGAFLLRNTGAQAKAVPGLLASVGWLSEGQARPCYFQEGTVHAAGAAISWLRDNLGLLGSDAELDAACRASRERVWALPAIGGLGAPRWDYATKTAFFGLSSQTRKADLVRAVVEGLAFLVADIAEAMRRGGAPVRGLKASGGLSRNDYLMQFQADILGARVERCEEPEATARGAASLAAEAAGDRSWAKVLAAPKIDRTFSPRMKVSERSSLLGAWKDFVGAQAELSARLR